MCNENVKNAVIKTRTYINNKRMMVMNEFVRLSHSPPSSHTRRLNENIEFDIAAIKILFSYGKDKSNSKQTFLAQKLWSMQSN